MACLQAIVPRTAVMLTAVTSAAAMAFMMHAPLYICPTSKQLLTAARMLSQPPLSFATTEPQAIGIPLSLSLSAYRVRPDG